MPGSPDNLDEALLDLGARQRREFGRSQAQRPKKIADVLGQVVSRNGYARLQSGSALDEAWREAAGATLASQCRLGAVRRGELEVIVAHSTLVQELTFLRDDLLAKLQERHPEQKLKKIRFRVGSVA
jgi:hypothetical protein